MSVPILDAAKVTETVARLRQRINERFPGSGLYEICGKLEQVAGQTGQLAEKIGQPILWVRIVIWLVVILISVVGMIMPFILKLGFSDNDLTIKDFLELGDPVLNEVVLIGAALFFLLTLETRIKRGRALKAVHELRSIAHVIDMHQLTKDPERVIESDYQSTGQSPRPTMTQFQLRRYLDYCSEMLSLTGKLAALYVQHFDDGVALQSVNEVESLTTGLSRKIWQKIMILHASMPATRSAREFSPLIPRLPEPVPADPKAPPSTSPTSTSPTSIAPPSTSPPSTSPTSIAPPSTSPPSRTPDEPPDRK